MSCWLPADKKSLSAGLWKQVRLSQENRHQFCSGIVSVTFSTTATYPPKSSNGKCADWTVKLNGFFRSTAPALLEEQLQESVFGIHL
mmetsp:Transcript_159894/g.291894  ORF Transcript_159894/g.291894 Transcript_159894/m.291894 type:complete len:87 (+) Transcript_159894:259-519(+)